MRPRTILTVLVLSVMLTSDLGAAQGPCLPPGITPAFLSWPARRVIPKTPAEALPGETIMYRDAATGSKVLTVEVNGVMMVVDPAPDAEVIEFWVRIPTVSCEWRLARERAA